MLEKELAQVILLLKNEMSLTQANDPDQIKVNVPVLAENRL